MSFLISKPRSGPLLLAPERPLEASGTADTGSVLNTKGSGMQRSRTTMVKDTPSVLPSSSQINSAILPTWDCQWGRDRRRLELLAVVCLSPPLLMLEKRVKLFC